MTTTGRSAESSEHPTHMLDQVFHSRRLSTEPPAYPLHPNQIRQETAAVNIIEMATSLAQQVRAEGSTSRAVLLGLHLTVAVCDAAEPPDIDAQLRWGMAAVGVRGILDMLDPQPARRIELPTDLTSGTDLADTAPALVGLLTAIADTFDLTADGYGDRIVRHQSAWYRLAEQDLRAAAHALTP